MAVHTDFTYLRDLIGAGVVSGPVLELGSRAWQGEAGNARAECVARGVEWSGADMVAGPGVDFVLDVLDRAAVAAVGHTYQAVLLFNLLEHVYNPIEALANSMQLVAPGGVAVVVGPAVWQLHDFPRDFWRPMPDFYIEFASRNGYELIDDWTAWLVEGRVLPVDRFSIGTQKKIPSISRPGVIEVWGRPRAYWSRGVHALLRTFGRATAYPDCGLGVVIRRPAT